MRSIRPVGITAALACGLVVSVGAAGSPAVAGTARPQAAVASVAPPAANAAPAARHAGAARPAATAALAATPSAAAAPVLRRGSKGAAVLTAQRRLAALGYWLGTPDGVYGDSTFHAVTALQKVAGLARDGVLGPNTRRALDRGVRPTPASRKGYVAEVNLKRQILMFVRNGKVLTIYDASTGSGELYRTSSGGLARAVTPKGTYRVFRQIKGWHTAPLGLLYSPKYFNGGIAIHGSRSVPPYPASHGCVRVTVAAMDLLWKGRALAMGRTVKVT